MEHPSLTRYAWLSIAAAIATILLKGTAWWLTGSVGLLSDAIESFVNLAAAMMALWILTVAASPADDRHAFGHSKAEYFSSAFEGLLIVFAALSIISRLMKMMRMLRRATTPARPMANSRPATRASPNTSSRARSMVCASSSSRPAFRSPRP